MDTNTRPDQMSSSPESRSVHAELYAAIVEGDVDRANSLLDTGVAPGYITIKYSGDLCVYCAVKLETPVSRGEPAVLAAVCTLIAAGQCACAGVEAADQVTHGVTPLHLASAYGPPSLVRRLLDAGYAATATSLRQSSTALHYLALGLTSQKQEIAGMLLAAGARATALNARRNLPLHLALMRYESSLAMDLLNRTDPATVDTENISGETPLLLAVKAALEPSLVSALVAAGADVNRSDHAGLRPISVAIHKDSPEIVRLLTAVPSADVNLPGRPSSGLQAMTPLLYATCRESESAVTALLDRGALVDVVEDGSQPLLVCAYTDNVRIARALVTAGADVDLAPRQGYSTLHHAAWEGHDEMVALLLEAGASPDTQTDDKNTPLALAAHGAHLDTMRLLLARSPAVNNADKDLDTPLHYAAYNGQSDAVRLLLGAGADPASTNSFGTTPLWNAVYAGDTASTQLLVQCNVRLSAPSVGVDQHAQTDTPSLLYPAPRTPLYVACARRHRHLAVILLLAGVAHHHEPWFWDADFPAALPDNPPLLHWLTQQLTNPRSLLRLARNCIRSQLGTHPQHRIDSLYIPTVLKHFLLIKNFDRDL